MYYIQLYLSWSVNAISPKSTEMIKVPRLLFERLRDIAVYAA